jgi:hypothetical protein
MMVVLGNARGHFGFFIGFVTDFLLFANPTALWLEVLGFQSFL